MTEKPSTTRPTDDDARRQARILLRSARFGALAVLEPGTGFPHASRTLIGTDVDGAPVVLLSTLALHTQALIADGRCSLLVGEPGKGDPLAWPRLTVQGRAEPVTKDSELGDVIRCRFLRRHPKSKLYADFGDFQFYKIEIENAYMNGGFGRSYKILRDDLLIESPFNTQIRYNELYILSEVAKLDPEAPNLLANKVSALKSYNWEFSGIDASGLDLAHNEHLVRVELEEPAQDIKWLIAEYKRMLMEIREI